MTRLSSLGKNSLVYGVGQVLTRALSVLFLPLLTRYLTPTDYGAIGLLAIVNAVLQPLMALGTTMSLGPLYFRTADESDRRAAIGTALVFNLVAGTALFAIGWAAAPSLTRQAHRAELLPLVPYALAGAAFSQPLAVVQLWLQFTEQSRGSVALTLVQTVATLLFATLLVIHFHLGAQGMVMASAIALGLSAAIGIGMLLTKLRPMFSRAVIWYCP